MLPVTRYSGIPCRPAGVWSAYRGHLLRSSGHARRIRHRYRVVCSGFRVTAWRDRHPVHPSHMSARMVGVVAIPLTLVLLHPTIPVPMWPDVVTVNSSANMDASLGSGMVRWQLIAVGKVGVEVAEPIEDTPTHLPKPRANAVPAPVFKGSHRDT